MLAVKIKFYPTAQDPRGRQSRKNHLTQKPT